MLIRESTIWFPTAGPKTAMNSVTVIAYPERHNAISSCASHSKRSAIKELLGYSRDGEGIESIDTDVVVRFDDDSFQGRSFGLALAIADKLARFQTTKKDTAPIVATGTMGAKGDIFAVDQFTKKIGFLLEQMSQGSSFLYPLANQPGNEENLQALEKRGVAIFATSNIADIEWLWLRSPGHSNSGRLPATRNLLEFSIGLLVGFVIPVFAVTMLLR